MADITNPWKPIKSFKGRDYEEVDVWMVVSPSPRSFGMGDAFRVPDAYRVEGEWFHLFKGEKTQLYDAYITHWCPIIEPPARKNGKSK